MKKQVLPFFAIAVFAVACGQSSTPQTDSVSSTTTPATTEVASASTTIQIPDEVNMLLNKHTCLTCHAAGEKIVGPAYKDVATKNYTNEQIVELIHAPKPEHWPDYPPMAPLPNVPKDDALKIAAWINSLK